MDEITVGFVFSFPVQHLSIKSGKVIKWTKGFQNEGAIGNDPVALLKAAFRREVHPSFLRSSQHVPPPHEATLKELISHWVQICTLKTHNSKVSFIKIL